MKKSNSNNSSFSENIGRFDNRKPLLYSERINRILQGDDINPVSVEIDAVSRAYCNHDCFFCTFDHLKARKPKMLPRDVILRIPVELGEAGVRGVVWTGGGEPTIHPELWNALWLCKEQNLSSGIFTNGSLLDIDKCKTIVQTCSFVRISLDAHNQITHARIHQTKSADFEPIIANIELLTSLKEQLRSRTTIGVSFLVCPQNYEGIVTATRLAKQLNVNYFQLKPVVMASDPQISPDFFHNIQAHIEEAKLLATDKFKVEVLDFKFSDMKKGGAREYHKCWAHPFMGAIGADCNVYVCCHMKGIREFSYGSLKYKSWKEIWNGIQRKQVATKVNPQKCPILCKGHELNKYAKVLSGIDDPGQVIRSVLAGATSADDEEFL